MIPTDEAIVIDNNFDILLVIDSTISMNAEDYNGNNPRLTGVINDCKYRLSKLSGSKFSIITFNNLPRTLIPYTEDVNLVIDAIHSIRPLAREYARGSSLNTPRDAIISSLKPLKKDEKRKQFIFFISDGEITDNSTLTSYSEIKKYVHGGAVLGYGTASGGKMKSDYFSNSVNKDDYIYTTINGKREYGISKIDETNLKKIANDIGIDYIKMNSSNDIDYKIEELLNMLIVEPNEVELEHYDDIYYYFLIPLILLFILKITLNRKDI